MNNERTLSTWILKDSLNRIRRISHASVLHTLGLGPFYRLEMGYSIQLKNVIFDLSKINQYLPIWFVLTWTKFRWPYIEVDNLRQVFYRNFIPAPLLQSGSKESDHQLASIFYPYWCFNSRYIFRSIFDKINDWI